MQREVRITDGKAYCERCGKVVGVMEKPGKTDSVQLRHVLVDGVGHVVAERAAKNEHWRSPT